MGKHIHWSSGQVGVQKLWWKTFNVWSPKLLRIVHGVQRQREEAAWCNGKEVAFRIRSPEFGMHVQITVPCLLAICSWTSFFYIQNTNISDFILLFHSCCPPFLFYLYPPFSLLPLYPHTFSFPFSSINFLFLLLFILPGFLLKCHFPVSSTWT